MGSLGPQQWLLVTCYFGGSGVFAVLPAGYISPYANSLSCTTSIQHITIARGINLHTGHDSLGKKHSADTSC